MQLYIYLNYHRFYIKSFKSLKQVNLKQELELKLPFFNFHFLMYSSKVSKSLLIWLQPSFKIKNKFTWAIPWKNKL